MLPIEECKKLVDEGCEILCKAVLDKPIDKDSILGNLGERAYDIGWTQLGGSATMWGMPPEWDQM
eukprot:3753966-Amphidinium_carterae.1